jgi:hypothetical protein
MIKFFRKIRQNMIKENKVSKYLLYAFGEIVLVVIGILIALNINNRNIEHQKEVRMQSILQSISDDLATDILKINEVLEYEKRQDSLLTIITTGNLTRDNFNNVIASAMFIEKIEISDNAFNNLVKSIDEIPKQYQGIYDGLNFLHIRLKPNVIDYSKLIHTRMMEEYDKWSNTKLWYYKMMDKKGRGLPNEFIEFALDDPLFKNYALQLRLLIFNHLSALKAFKQQAASSYTDIHKLLGKKNELPDFIPSQMSFNEISLSQDILKSYIGKYQSENNDVKTVQIEDMRIYVIHDNGNKNEVFPYEEDNFFVKKADVQLKFNKEKNEIVGFTETYNGKETYYIKIE